MKINKYHGSYNITKRTQTVKYIVCHYTGSGSSKAGNAKNNCIFFSNGDRGSSAHFFIDDSGIWEYADPSTYYTWHCGDGHGKYGITNANSIGIEVCLDGDNPYTEKEIGYLSELVRYLMGRFDVPASRVVRHYDASRKLCPLYYAKRQSAWDSLHSRITKGVKMGWVKDSRGWWYRRSDGSYPKSEWEKIDGKWYYFDSKGYMLTGWITTGGKWYYLNPKGDMRTGWLKDNGAWYYLDTDGHMIASCFRKTDGKWFAFKANGKMVEDTAAFTIAANGAITIN